MGSFVETITTDGRLNQVLGTEKLLVLEFMSPRSDPCKYMKPKLESVVASAYKDKDDICFYALSVHDFKELAEYLEVEALPAFFLVHRCYVKKEVVGVDVEELQQAIDKVYKAIKKK